MVRSVLSTPVSWPLRTGLPRRGWPLWLACAGLLLSCALIVAWLWAWTQDAWLAHRADRMTSVLAWLGGGVCLWLLMRQCRQAWSCTQTLTLLWLGAVDKHLRAEVQSGQWGDEAPCAGFLLHGWAHASSAGTPGLHSAELPAYAQGAWQGAVPVRVRLRLDFQGWMLLQLRLQLGAGASALAGAPRHEAWVWVNATRLAQHGAVPAQGVGSWHHLRTLLHLPVNKVDWPAGEGPRLRSRGSMASWGTSSHSGTNLSRPLTLLRPRLKKGRLATGPTSSLFPATEWMPSRDEAATPSSEVRS